MCSKLNVFTIFFSAVILFSNLNAAPFPINQDSLNAGHFEWTNWNDDPDDDGIDYIITASLFFGNEGTEADTNLTIADGCSVAFADVDFTITFRDNRYIHCWDSSGENRITFLPDPSNEELENAGGFIFKSSGNNFYNTQLLDMYGEDGDENQFAIKLDSVEATVSMTNCLINEALSRGIWIADDSCKVSLDSTFITETEGTGGGIHLWDTDIDPVEVCSLTVRNGSKINTNDHNGIWDQFSEDNYLKILNSEIKYNDVGIEFGGTWGEVGDPDSSFNATLYMEESHVDSNSFFGIGSIGSFRNFTISQNSTVDYNSFILDLAGRLCP